MASTTSTKTSTKAGEKQAPAPEVTVEKPAEPVLKPATELDAEVKAAYEAVTPFLQLAKMTDRTLSVEFRGDRQRMACSWGRNSYFADSPKDGGIAVPVKAALLRQIARLRGKAIRAIKGDEKLAKKLAALIEAEKPAPVEETPAS